MKLEIQNKGDEPVMVGGLPLLAGARATFEFEESEVMVCNAMIANEAMSADVSADQMGVGAVEEVENPADQPAGNGDSGNQ